MFDPLKLYLGTPYRLATVYRSRLRRARTASRLLSAATVVVTSPPARPPWLSLPVPASCT